MRVALIGDDADVGMHQAFLHRDAGRREIAAQLRRQWRARDQRMLDRRRAVAPARHIEQALEEIGRADKAAWRKRAHHVGDRDGVVRAGGDDGAAERLRAGVHQEAERAQMIGEAVEHDVAWAHAGREQHARRAPPVLAPDVGVEHRPRRHQHAARASALRQRETAEQRIVATQRRPVVGAQQRDMRKRFARGDVVGIDAVELARPAGAAERQRDEIGQPPEQAAFAGVGIVDLSRVVEVLTHGKLHAATLP